MKLHPIHFPQATMLAIRNMSPDSFPVQPIESGKPLLTQVQIPIPKQHYEGDWIVSIEDDIKWLNDKSPSSVGDGLWVRETHRYLLDWPRVICEYGDLEKRAVPIDPCEVRFPERKMAPLCMFKRSARYVLKIHSIDTVWVGDGRTALAWKMDVSRIGNVEELLRDESK